MADTSGCDVGCNAASGAVSAALIVDSSIWIDLHQFGLIEKLVLLPYAIRVPDFVWAELMTPSGEDMARLGWAPDTFDPEELLRIWDVRRQCAGLSVADVSNIVLGMRLRSAFRVVFLAAQDAKLRREAQKMGLECKDGLDLLNEMVEAGIVNKTDASMLAPLLARGRPAVTGPKVAAVMAKWRKEKSQAVSVIWHKIGR